MSAKPKTAPPAAPEGSQTRPEMLLSKLRKGNIIVGLAVSVLLHFVLIGSTWLMFPAKETADAANPANPDAGTTENADGTTESQPANGEAGTNGEGAGTNNQTATTGGNADTSGNAGSRGNGETGGQTAATDNGEGDPEGGINTESPVYRAINETARPEDIMREPDPGAAMNLEFNEDDLLGDEPARDPEKTE